LLKKVKPEDRDGIINLPLFQRDIVPQFVWNDLANEFKDDKDFGYLNKEFENIKDAEEKLDHLTYENCNLHLYVTPAAYHNFNSLVKQFFEKHKKGGTLPSLYSNLNWYILNMKYIMDCNFNLGEDSEGLIECLQSGNEYNRKRDIYLDRYNVTKIYEQIEKDYQKLLTTSFANLDDLIKTVLSKKYEGLGNIVNYALLTIMEIGNDHTTIKNTSNDQKNIKKQNIFAQNPFESLIGSMIAATFMDQQEESGFIDTVISDINKTPQIKKFINSDEFWLNYNLMLSKLLPTYLINDDNAEFFYEFINNMDLLIGGCNK
jgi:hypothetical protein